MGEKNPVKIYEKIWIRYEKEMKRALRIKKSRLEIAQINRKYNELLNFYYIRNIKYFEGNGRTCHGCYSYK